MFARVATTQSQPERLEEIMRRLRDQTVPVLQAQKGFRGCYGMVDRESGKAVAISLWETEEKVVLQQARQLCEMNGARLMHRAPGLWTSGTWVRKRRLRSTPRAIL